MSRLLGAILAALLLAGAGWYLRGQRDREQQAADRAQLASYRQTIDELLRQTARVDTAYVRDTVRLARWRNRWDTVRVERTDTLISVDTLRLVVAVADSTIQACTMALETCEARDRLRVARIAADSSQLRALSRALARAKLRNRLSCTVGPTATLDGVSYVGLACGIRIW